MSRKRVTLYDVGKAMGYDMDGVLKRLRAKEDQTTLRDRLIIAELLEHMDEPKESRRGPLSMATLEKMSAAQKLRRYRERYK